MCFVFFSRARARICYYITLVHGARDAVTAGPRSGRRLLVPGVADARNADGTAPFSGSLALRYAKGDGHR